MASKYLISFPIGWNLLPVKYILYRQAVPFGFVSGSLRRGSGLKQDRRWIFSSLPGLALFTNFPFLSYLSLLLSGLLLTTQRVNYLSPYNGVSMFCFPLREHQSSPVGSPPWNVSFRSVVSCLLSMWPPGDKLFPLRLAHVSWYGAPLSHLP